MWRARDAARDRRYPPASGLRLGADLAIGHPNAPWHRHRHWSINETPVSHGHPGRVGPLTLACRASRVAQVKRGCLDRLKVGPELMGPSSDGARC